MIAREKFSVEEEGFMEEALQLAVFGANHNEVPVGAVVVHQGKVIGRGYNSPVSQYDPAAHAEIQALREAGRTLKNYRLVDCDLYVTVEPCTMCAGAIVHSRIRKLYYGAPEPKAGVACSQGNLFAMPYLNHKVQVAGGLYAEKSREVLQTFFKKKRQKKKHHPET